MIEWHDFFVAAAGASAALTGLIFVGVSINLSRILSGPALPSRAFISIVLLLTILIVALLMLIPTHSTRTPGVAILFTGCVVWVFILYADIKIIRNKENQYRRIYLFNLTFNQLAILPYLAGSFLLLYNNESGTYCISIAFVLSFIKATLDAWVLLVEINR